MSDVVKIGIVAKELGVCPKTIYNWINRGRLSTLRPGYVDRGEAQQAHANQKKIRAETASQRVRQSTKRDAYGRFTVAT